MNRQTLLLICLTVLLAACGRQSDGTTETVAEMSKDSGAKTTEPATTGLPQSESADGASVFFAVPADGATVSNPVTIEFGINGMDVVKAGVQQAHSGHHHLLINTELPALGLPIPADENHIHFGDGSTSTQITLAPGEHRLQMLLGDHLHIPHNPPLMSEVITITVE